MLTPYLLQGSKTSSSSTLPTGSDLSLSDDSEDMNGKGAGVTGGTGSHAAGANGADNISKSEYARACCELLEIVRDLRALG